MSRYYSIIFTDCNLKLTPLQDYKHRNFSSTNRLDSRSPPSTHAQVQLSRTFVSKHPRKGPETAVRIDTALLFTCCLVTVRLLTTQPASRRPEARRECIVPPSRSTKFSVLFFLIFVSLNYNTIQNGCRAVYQRKDVQVSEILFSFLYNQVLFTCKQNQMGVR